MLLLVVLIVGLLGKTVLRELGLLKPPADKASAEAASRVDDTSESSTALPSRAPLDRAREVEAQILRKSTERAEPATP